MEVGSPEWIEASLAKLEQLEQERATHQQAIETTKEPMSLRRHTEALGRLDAEIKALYAQLEAFAEDDEDEQEEGAGVELEAPVPTPDRRTVDDESLSAPHAAAVDDDEEEDWGTAARQSAPSNPLPSTVPTISTPPVAASIDIPAPTPTVSSYDDDEPKGGAGKWVVLGVLLVGGLGAGGFFMMQDKKQPDTQPAQNAGSGEVIKAADIPDDTEAPKAAKGADVDRTPVENGGAAGTTGGGGGGKKKNDKEDTKKVIKLGEGEDPLG